MPTNHQAKAAFPISSAADQTQARKLAVLRQAYIVSAASEVPDLVAVDPDTGDVIQDILCLGRVFHYDSTDVLTAQDGTTVLVSSDGKRYKLAAGSDIVAYSVLDIVTTTPPVSPTLGDQYLVAVGGTGDWSGHDEEIATYTARGWEFSAVEIGRLIYNEDTDTYYRKKADGTIVAGFGSQTLSADSVKASSLIGRPWRPIVINATTNTPPGSPSTGDSYIVGSSPTGAWAGHAGDIAVWEDSVWGLYAARTGEKVFDQAAGGEKIWTGGAWVAANDGMTLIATQVASNVATIDFVDGINGVVLDDTYDGYMLVVTNAKPATDDVEAWLRVGTGAGPSWQTSNYDYAATVLDTTGSSAVGGTAQAKIIMSRVSASADVGNAAGENWSGDIRFNNPEASDFCLFNVSAVYVAANGTFRRVTGGGRYATAGAITGIRWMFESGNIASGRFSLYGLRKA